MRTIGLDVGERRIGVALSDEEGILASPLMIIDASDEDTAITKIREMSIVHCVNLVVIGLPVSMDGSIGKQAERVEGFINKLSTLIDIPIKTWDERLSSVAVARAMRETNARRGKKKKRIDAMAAAIILQGYLDRVKNSIA